MQINFVYVLPFAVFGAFAAGAWWLLEVLGSSKPRAEQRLDEFRDPRIRKRNEAERAGRAADTMAKVLEKATPALAKPLQPKNEKEVGRLKLKLSHAGFRAESAPSIFLGLKFFGLIFGGLLGGGAMLLLGGFNQTSLIRAVGAAGVMFYMPNIVVAILASRRKQAIFLGLPDAIDLMVVCVEAGLGMDQAMRKVAEEMTKSYPIVAKEFSVCNFHLQLGRTRNEVLHDLGERTGVEDLQALAAILIQADKFGASVGKALRVQSDSMRVRRHQLAEEKAAKTAVKLIFPLVLFIFPGIFVVLVGPAAITMINDMFPKMGG